MIVLRSVSTVLLMCLMVAIFPVTSGAADYEKIDDLRVYKTRAAVMEVSRNCKSIVIGEATFEVGSWVHKGKYYQTKLLDSSGNPMDRCRFSYHDRVYVKSVVRRDDTLYALVIQKMDP